MDYWKRSLITRRTAMRRGGYATAGLAGALVVGCDDDNTATPATQRPTQQAIVSPTVPAAAVVKKGGTVRIGGLAPTIDNADIHQATNDPGVKDPQYVLDTLQLLDEEVPAQFKQVPNLAETLEQPDDTTYIYRLRKGVKFANVAPVNGRVFTAEDAAFSLKRMATNDPRYVRRSWLDKATAIEALDANTLRIKTSTPVASLSYLLASPWVGMIAKEQVDRDGDQLKTYIGTGPYMVDRIEPGITITYKRNPDYWGSGGNFDRVELVSIPDKSAEAAAFRADEIQELAAIPADTIESLKKQVPSANQYKTPSAGLGVVAFNGLRKPFDDVRVRRAIALACDLPGWLQTVFAGQGGLSGPIAPPFTDWALPESRLKYRTQNLTEAKKLFDAAGIQTASTTLKVLTLSVVPSYVAMATNFQQDMKQLGITVQIEPVSNADYSSRFFTKHDFDILVGQDFSPDDPDRLYDRFHSTASGNYAAYKNPVMDALLEKQRSTVNKEQRKQLVQQVQDLIEEDVPTLYTVFNWGFSLSSGKLTNWRATALSGNQTRWNARNAWYSS